MSPGVKASRSKAGRPWVLSLLLTSKCHGRKPVGIYYDRVGHFAQGFVPAILAREVLLRTSPLRAGKWLFFLVCCVPLAISAFYELVEWWAALLTSPETGTAFLGTQGDVWDTQWDMALALVGAICSQLFLGRLHDAQLTRRAEPPVQSDRASPEQP